MYLKLKPVQVQGLLHVLQFDVLLSGFYFVMRVYKHKHLNMQDYLAQFLINFAEVYLIFLYQHVHQVIELPHK